MWGKRSLTAYLLLTRVKAFVRCYCCKERRLGAEIEMKLGADESGYIASGVCIWLPSRLDSGWVGYIDKNKALKGGIPMSAWLFLLIA